MHVKQRPGFSYPHPPRRAYIHTEMIHVPENFHQPPGDKFHVVNPGYVPGLGADCPPGQEGGPVAAGH